MVFAPYQAELHMGGRIVAVVTHVSLLVPGSASYQLFDLLLTFDSNSTRHRGAVMLNPLPPELCGHQTKLTVGHQVLGTKVHASASHFFRVQRNGNLGFQVVSNPCPSYGKRNGALMTWSECVQKSMTRWNSLDKEPRIWSVYCSTGKLVNCTVQMMGSSSEWMDGPINSSRVEFPTTNVEICSATMCPLANSMFRKLGPYQLAPGLVPHARTTRVSHATRNNLLLYCYKRAHICKELVMPDMLGIHSNSGSSFSATIQDVPVNSSMSPFVGLAR